MQKLGTKFYRVQKNGPAPNGYSLIELMVVVLIIVIGTAIAVPLVQNATTSYRMRSAVNSLSGLIQATRYKAISAGYEYELVMTKATGTFQMESDSGNSSGCSSCANVTGTGSSGSLWGSSVSATLGSDTTLLFHPGGKVDVLKGANPLLVNYGSLPQESITVSAYGNISVSP